MKAEFPQHYSDDQAEVELAGLVAGKVFQNEADALFQYFVPTPDLTALWTNCTFVFDANALTHAFVMTESLRDRYLQILESFEDRIWIPHHAAEEYHRHIADSVSDAAAPMASLIDLNSHFRKFVDDKTKQKYVQKAWHWFYDDASYEKLSAFIQQQMEVASAERLRVVKQYPKVKEQIADLFKGKVGQPASEQDVTDYDKEGERRLALQLPPSCEKDAKKPANKFGDVHIWLQIIQFAKTQSSRPIVFVTDDGKENWWLTGDAGRIGPRPELCLELKRLVGAELWICSTTSFIDESQKWLKLKPLPLVESALTRAKENEKIQDQFYSGIRLLEEQIRRIEQQQAEVNRFKNQGYILDPTQVSNQSLLNFESLNSSVVSHLAMPQSWMDLHRIIDYAQKKSKDSSPKKDSEDQPKSNE